MSDIVDLDALVPQPRTIKFGDEEIKIEPPSTADVMHLGVLGQKMADAGALEANELESTVEQLTQQVYKCVPGLNNKPLGTAQLLKLVQIISEMGIPADAKELEARGITAETPKKAL